MTENEYQEILKTVPDHNSPEFLDYLRENNPVIWENSNWLVIQNCKDKNVRTAFWKPSRGLFRPEMYLYEVLDQYPECEWRKKHANKQSIKRFHIHIIK